MKKLLAMILCVVMVMTIIPFTTLSAGASMADEAKSIEFGVRYEGATNRWDSQYFKFSLNKESHVSLVCSYSGGDWNLYSSSGNVVWSNNEIKCHERYNNTNERYSTYYGSNLKSGTYYLEYGTGDYSFTLDSESKISLPKGSITSLKNTGGRKMTIKCKSAANAIGYQFQYSTNEQFKKKTKTVKSPSTSKTITGLAPARYYVRSRPYSVYTDGTYVYGQYSIPKTVVVNLATPKISKLKNTKSGVKVTWGKVSGAAAYRVYRRTGNGKWKAIKGKTEATSFVDKSAKNGKTYYYTVRCISKDGKKYTSGFDKTGKKIKCKR